MMSSNEGEHADIHEDRGFLSMAINHLQNDHTNTETHNIDGQTSIIITNAEMSSPEFAKGSANNPNTQKKRYVNFSNTTLP